MDFGDEEGWSLVLALVGGAAGALVGLAMVEVLLRHGWAGTKIALPLADFEAAKVGPSLGVPADRIVALAKAFAAEMAERVTREAMQVHGGYGYSMEFEAQRFWRDARVLSIFEGTSEIQYEVIGRRIMEQN